MSFEKLCKNLEAKIVAAYTEGVTMDEAEKMAAEFLAGQFAVSAELKTADLSSRMRKSGVKAVKAAVYSDACAKADKKPTEGALEHLINMHADVNTEQDALDKAEVERDSLERYYNIFREAHTFMRGVARGRFDG